MLAGLQYRLWFAEGSLPHTAALEARLAKQQAANNALQERNDRLGVEVSALQQGSAQMEAHAREDLGLVKKDETYFMFVDEPGSAQASKP
ncbi:MAG: cell division protein FtsB [Pseudomonadales bacterium]|nr:cell division protein FtsB [Pseudomonadales bacterium]